MPGTTPLKSSLPTKCSSHLRNASGFGDPLRLQSATGKLHSAVLVGGIAQLVERQLCKLEVRGSNPLASSLRSRRREERRLSRRSLGEGGLFYFRFAIADLSRCARTASRNKIENRQSTFENLAAQPRHGPVAQLVRACA